MIAVQQQQRDRDRHPEAAKTKSTPHLDNQYRRIGLSAVAAAAPYCSGNPHRDPQTAARSNGLTVRDFHD